MQDVARKCSHAGSSPAITTQDITNNRKSMTAKEIVIRLTANKQINQKEALTLLNELDKPYYPYYYYPYYLQSSNPFCDGTWTIDLPLTGVTTSGSISGGSISSGTTKNI
jgi:hypothetical protein